MSIKVALTHRTAYDFARPVAVGPHVVRLRPAPHCRTPIDAYSLEILPEEPLPELAAGPVRQLGGPDRLPREGQAARDHRRAGRGPDGDQPARLLHRGVRRAVPVRLRAGARGRPGAVPPAGRRQRGRARVEGRAPAAARRRRADRPLPLGAQRRRAPRRRLRRADGAGRPDPRRDARARHRLVPRQRLAAGQPAARVRPGGPVRLRLPRPARAGRLRHRGERRPDRRGRRLHRPARLGRGLHPRRRLGRPRPDQRAVRGRGPHPPERDAAPEQRGPDRGRHRGRRGHLRVRQRGAPGPRGPAGDGAVHRRPVGADRRGRPGRRRAAREGRRPADHGRRADLRRARRHGQRAVEHRRRRPREARGGQPAGRAAPADVRRGRRGPPRPGQVVPGRAAPALEHRPAVAEPTAPRCGRTRRSSPTRGPRPPTPTPPQARRRRWPAA